MNRIELNTIRLNTLALNRIGEGAMSVSKPEELPFGYQMLIDPNGNYLKDANGKIIIVPIENFIPEGYEPAVDENGNILVDAEDNVIFVPIEDEENGEDAEPKPIKFTLEGKEYSAIEGMTWLEFCQSEYNVDGWECYDGEDWVWIEWIDNGVYWVQRYVCDYNQDGVITPVVGADTIKNGTEYREYMESSDGIG